MRITKRYILAAGILLCALAAQADVRLPKLIGDGMVLQRNAPVRVWGWAAAGESVAVHFMKSTYKTTVNTANGEWEVMLPAMSAGGPYEMTIEGHNSIVLKDILIGDVWVCSGQSNMQLGLGGLTALYQAEIDQMTNPLIRQFSTFPGTNFIEREKDFKSGRWQHADAKSVRNLTAAGYFFAKTLFDAYRIPIGIIHISLGGSSAEAWISEESIANFPIYYEALQRFKDPAYIDRINKQDNERVKTWNTRLWQNDEGYKNPQQPWFDPALNTSDWAALTVPGYWTTTPLGNANGVVWFRKVVTISAAMAGKPATLKLGRIFDIDSVYLNGKFIGTTGSQYAPRSYAIPKGGLKEGVNTLVVRVVSTIRHGGFVPGKEYQLRVGDEKISLEGEWKYKRGAAAEPLDEKLFTGKIPSGLFNAGIAPLLKYRIKGVAWYQGESNTSRAFEHYELFKLLIKDWRANWRQGDFSFVYVQLPNFDEVNVEDTKCDWAFFRESQLKALSIPNTGMAVTVDIGEGNDIHPSNKKDVGYRLALAAQHVAYGEKNIVYSGPMYESRKINGKTLVLTFSNVGRGMVAKNGGALRRFEICGADNEYFPASATIKGKTIILSSDKVTAPVAARYAWANNPEGANLYNKEGLPASPFRTDYLH